MMNALKNTKYLQYLHKNGIRTRYLDQLPPHIQTIILISINKHIKIIKNHHFSKLREYNKYTSSSNGACLYPTLKMLFI